MNTFTLLINGFLSFFMLLVMYHRVVDCNINHEKIERMIERNMIKLESEYRFMMWLLQTLEWNYAVNMTVANGKEKDNFETLFSEWMSKWKSWAKNLPYIPTNKVYRRIIKIMANGIVFSSPEMAKRTSELRNSMAAIYARGQVDLSQLRLQLLGEEEVGFAMSKVKNPSVLKKLWREWRYTVGNRIKPLFLQLVSLLNTAARENDYHDIGEIWRSELGIDDLIAVAHQLWGKVSDFYYNIHAFVRRRLMKVYGKQYFNNDGIIPVHLLGSLWGDNWESLGNFVLPYPNVTVPDITESMLKRNLTVKDMLKISERFYTSMGMFPMTKSFWKNSMFVRPQDKRAIDCHGSAFDFSINDDFRIKICAEITEKDLRTIIHEMGHVEYFMSYRIQPMIFRSGANSAFHEAIGETMVYSAFSPKCLKHFGLWNGATLSKEQELNLLMQRALAKVVFLPWSLLIDLWRYEVFEGRLSSSDMTKRWWELRKYYQGVGPPSEEDIKEFDPGTKYHVANNVPYIRYYFSRFLEHQIHESLCRMSESTDESLHHCCLYGATQAGSILRFLQILATRIEIDNW
ncbi:angiotensin-converting enzyme-like isoform X3 [Centruroides sculpturatus]|uniref:angiotensin-converting enzyme-like isoform X3 n=1 Tax=Centruroides sculpturatus TaxID=218467 RepID=UPI000C6EE244|nr:angiotensin-converting enzyme-like isoform X3 [Centruroides sculpturatus]